MSTLSLTWVDEIGSTQDVLTSRARRGAAPQALATTSQTTGRGRRGREWTCLPGAGLAMSVLLRPERDDGWTWLPLLGGVVVLETVAGLGANGLSLKWPNDVLAGDAKLAGLLAERVDAPGPGSTAFVLGVGINLHVAGAPAGSAALDALGVGASAVEVADGVLARMEHWLQRWEESDSAVDDAYRTYCGTLGQQVRVTLPGRGGVEGQAAAIDRHGRLVVVGDAGERLALSAGDVEHLRPR